MVNVGLTNDERSVGVILGVTVGVIVDVGVIVVVTLGVGVTVFVGVIVVVTLGVGVTLFVGVTVLVGVIVGVGVGVTLFVGVGVFVKFCVGVGVGVDGGTNASRLPTTNPFLKIIPIMFINREFFNLSKLKIEPLCYLCNSDNYRWCCGSGWGTFNSLR